LAAAGILTTADGAEWTIYVANDNCPDYTWGFTEHETRQAFADIVKGHLDEMTRTDGQPPENRSRYNAAVTQEVLCFLERYPERKDELIRRVKEGRLYVSPYLCNSLWGFQSLEGAIRTFYPARRLQREWGFPMDTAHHIELPSLPWGTATILANCGLRNLSVPYYGYDSTFSGLKVPPVFCLEGPDGSRIRVAMDHWACQKTSYTQGAYLLRKPELIEKEWLPHYAGLGAAYPLRSILACGTHGDINPGSGRQARGFAEAIIRYNARPDANARLVNATYPQFWQAVDAELAKAGAVELPVVRGDFGHSWDLWPVSLARYAGEMRELEGRYLTAETLLAIAGHSRPELLEKTWEDRRRAEWCWAMLSDHAWNGTDDKNKRHNAELRKTWTTDFEHAWMALAPAEKAALKTRETANKLTLFNSLSVPRRQFVSPGVTGKIEEGSLLDGTREIPCQLEYFSPVEGNGGTTAIYFVSPQVPGFAFKTLEFRPGVKSRLPNNRVRATVDGIESPFYRLVVDRKTGGIASLVHKPTGREIVAPGKGRSLGQTVFFDGAEHVLDRTETLVYAEAPVRGGLRIWGTVAGIEVATWIELYADLDQVDIEVHVKKPVSTKQERLCQVFPVSREGMTLRVATPAAVVRPKRQPEGDLLPGADTRRFAVQEFVDVSDREFGVTIVPLNAFALRLDLDPLTFEALGNDQNYKEVSRDQNGETAFSFRYVLRAHAGGYRQAEAYAWSRGVAREMLVFRGELAEQPRAKIEVDPARAIATCLKPADGGKPEGAILRLQEVGGQSGPVSIGVAGYRKAVETDLLERDLKPLPISDGKVQLDLRAHGLGAVRLVP